MAPDRPESDAKDFTALAAAWLATHRSWNTRSAYEADLEWFATWCAEHGKSPLRVTQRDVERSCEASSDDGASAASVRRRLAALTSFYAFGASAGATADNPAEHVERPSAAADAAEAATLETHEARALAASASDLGLKPMVLVSLLLNDGLKLGEALRSDVDDVAGPPPTVTVQRQGRPHIIELHADTAQSIAAYTSGRSTGPLLLSDSPTRPAESQRLTRAGAHHLIKQAASGAGILKAVSANTLRRYYAASAHADGASLDELRTRLGLYDLRTTRRLLPEPPEATKQPRR